MDWQYQKMLSNTMKKKKYNFVTVINGDQELVVPIDIVISR